MDKKVTSFLQNIFPDDVKWKVRLLDNWHSIIGPMGTKVMLLQIREPMLILGVSHPAWVQELHLLKTTIQHTINSFLGKEYIKNIHFQVVPPSKTTALPKSPSLVRKKSFVEHRSLTHQEEEALQNVNDNDLRDALRRYLAYCKPINKS